MGTDGSHAMDKTLGQFLLGKGNPKVGGAIILSDGATWVYRILVRIDVKATKAFSVELICILVANEIALAQGGGVTIHSDCKAAIDVANGTWSMDFRNTTNNWKLGPGVVVQKVRAHPERYLHHSRWSWDDRGIWTADRVAGGNMAYECTVGAAKWLKKISSKSLVVIEELDGTPFIGSVRDRSSKRNMEMYWVERDQWRAKDGLPGKWEGTNMSHAFSLLKRNGGLEDHATMLRLASGKQWEYQRYNKVTCKACQGDFRGSAHPLLRCPNLTMVAARKLWKDNCYEHVRSSKPARLRNKLLEMLHHVWTSDGGEFAALGTFIPEWVGRIDDAVTMPAHDLNAIKKLLRVIA
jgi:hypothetical protein